MNTMIEVGTWGSYQDYDHLPGYETLPKLGASSNVSVSTAGAIITDPARERNLSADAAGQHLYRIAAGDCTKSWYERVLYGVQAMPLR